jgi:hypothetical protein
MGRDDDFSIGPYDLSAPPRWDDFPGLYPPLYTQTPDVFFDWVAPFLPEIELRVLIYLIRRTLGFKKQGDQITIEQIANGIVTREGVRLDWGTQLGERSVQRALAGLEGKGLIERHRQIDPERGYRPSYIRLRLCDQMGGDWLSRGRSGHQGGVQSDAREVSGESPAPRLAGRQGGVAAITPSPQGQGVRRDTYKKQSLQYRDPQETVRTPPAQETEAATNGTVAPPLWDRIKEELAAELAPSVYASRVAATTQIACAGGTLTIRCPDAATGRWLERSLGRKVAQIAALFVDEPPRMRFVAPE